MMIQLEEDGTITRKSQNSFNKDHNIDIFIYISRICVFEYRYGFRSKSKKVPKSHKPFTVGKKYIILFRRNNIAIKTLSHYKTCFYFYSA